MLCHNYCSWLKSVFVEFVVNNVTTVLFPFSIIHLISHHVMGLVV
jgi:hypothetical protein